MDDATGRDAGWHVRDYDPTVPILQAIARSLRSRSARGWFVGGGVSLFWLVPSLQQVLVAPHPPLVDGAGVVLLVLYAVAFLSCAPIAWVLPNRAKLVPAGILFALSFALVPWLGWFVSSNWAYVGVAIATAGISWRVTWPPLVLLAALAVPFQAAAQGAWTTSVLWLPAVLLSISMMMAAFTQTQLALLRLRASQRQVEQLAVERERGRLARDMHDILGHSLTVITVKSELAGRLIDADPARARAELAEVEALARGALADVRATVAGVRAVTVSAELAAARAALDAAGIAAELPTSTDAVGPAHRELAGWVLREGVTNVVRHSAASLCRVRLDADTIEVADDGIGPVPATRSSTGLAGLRERVEAAGGRMTVGRSDLGGFSLKVAL